MSQYERQAENARDRRRAKQSTEKTPSQGHSRIHWVNITFTAAQKRQLRETPQDVGREVDTLARFIDQGYKLVFSPKNDQGFCGATLLGHTEQCPDKGYGISGEGGDFYAAMRSLCAKLDILDGRLSGDYADPDDDFR